MVLNHVKDLGPFFSEINRVLKSGGILVFDDVNPDGDVIPIHRDVIFEHSQKKKKVFYHHSTDSIIRALYRAVLKPADIKFMRVDRTIRYLITRSSYEESKGGIFGVGIKARKLKAHERL